MPDVGFRAWLELDYRVMEDGHAVVAIPLTPEKQNLRDVAHGGIVASLIDIAMGTAAAGGNYDTRKRFVVTLEMKVNYLTPAEGTELVATADVVRAGGRTSVVRCEVMTDCGILCAVGLGTFMSRKPHPNDERHGSVPLGEASSAG